MVVFEDAVTPEELLGLIVLGPDGAVWGRVEDVGLCGNHQPSFLLVRVGRSLTRIESSDVTEVTSRGVRLACTRRDRLPA